MWNRIQLLAIFACSPQVPVSFGLDQPPRIIILPRGLSWIYLQLSIEATYSRFPVSMGGALIDDRGTSLPQYLRRANGFAIAKSLRISARLLSPFGLALADTQRTGVTSEYKHN